MKILQVHNLYVHPGGEDTIADTEAELLRAAGHEVERFRVRNERGLAAAPSYLAAPWNPVQEWAMRARVQQLRPDVAHVHNTWFTLSPAIFRALHGAGVPTVMTIQNFRLVCAEAKLFRDGRQCMDCVGTHQWRAVRYGCYRDSRSASVIAAGTIALNRRLHTWDRINRFFAPSEWVKGIFVRAGFAPHRIAVKPNVVRDPGPRSKPPSASNKLIYVGRLSHEKGPSLLLQAWRGAASRLPDYELVLIGDGPQRSELERDAPPRTRFVGHVEPRKLDAHMLSARALIFPTQCSENFGRSIVEAMAAGMPVLASDISTPAELVGELGEHWIVPPHDIRAWAEALVALSDGELVDEAGSLARQLFERKYTFDVGLKHLLAAYEAIRAPSLDASHR